MTPRERWWRYYQRSGGVADGDDIARRLRAFTDQPISRLARWVVARQVLVLPGPGPLLLPLFQFDFGLGERARGLAPALAELGDVFDDEELVSWFATPNPTLDGLAPVEALPHAALLVHQAARIDRFIAAG